MLPILINLMFVSGFCFCIIITLEYAIHLRENQKIKELTKDNFIEEFAHFDNQKTRFDQKTNNLDNFNYSDMKFNLSNKYFERSLVLVKSQDYKGWYEKAVEIIKKIFNNLGYYSQKFIKYIIGLSKSENNFSDRAIKHTKSTQSDKEINDTAKKITQIIENSSSQENPNSATIEQNIQTDIKQNPNPTQSNESFNIKEANSIIKTDTTGGATLNLAVDDSKIKDTTTYDKIEKSILTKLQETGLNHYDIWLELGQFYQKYDEKEKAIEIFAMVMKHAQGKDKDLARDGLIALS